MGITLTGFRTLLGFCCVILHGMKIYKNNALAICAADISRKISFSQFARSLFRAKYPSRNLRQAYFAQNISLAICEKLISRKISLSQIARSLFRAKYPSRKLRQAYFGKNVPSKICRKLFFPAGQASHKLRDACPARENRLTICEKLAPRGKTVSQFARSLPRTGKRSRNLQEACPERENRLTICKKLAPRGETVSQFARSLPRWEKWGFYPKIACFRVGEYPAKHFNIIISNN